MSVVMGFVCLYLYYFFFFFQAEDGIRDIGVTGVQTCALPISLLAIALNLAAIWIVVRVNPSVSPSTANVESAEKIAAVMADRKSTRLNSSHANISYAVFCLKKKKKKRKKK